MPIPTFDKIFLPLLKFLEDKKEHRLIEAANYIKKYYNLTPEELNERLESGTPRIDNRVGWARTFLKKANLLYYPKRGYLEITDEGLKLIQKNPAELSIKDLKNIPGFKEAWGTNKKNANHFTSKKDISLETPQETIESGFRSIQLALSQELLESIKSCSPYFFEKLVVELLLKMGYGGSLQEAGKAVGRSGDGGIDGIIKEDKLGLDAIYIQAKRWENVVGRPEIQKFVGALQGQKARKGVFITTSHFTKEAREYVNAIEPRVILINGKELTNLMIENNIGVTKIIAYEIKKIDSDYFIEG
jgi:restriction system protein